ncbi:protease HtpX [bacterium]|nr:MAG: protease HtpX [bacterium]
MLNTLKVGLLLTALTVMLVILGRAIGGPIGMLLALGFAVVMNLGSYWFSDKVVLRMAHAQPVSERDQPQLYRMTADLAQRAGVPMPKLYIVNDPQPNAFATGRNPQNAAVAVNTGLLQLLSRDEVAGVVAHELAHVKHRDTLTMAIVATLAGAIMTGAEIARIGAIFGMGSRNEDGDGPNPLVFFAMILLAPIAASMIQMTVSRAREYEADATAAHLTGSPDGLINALVKLERGASAIPTRSMTPQTAHLAIVNPLKALGGIANLFSTHPPMDKRIAALSALRGQIRPVGANPWA